MSEAFSMTLETEGTSYGFRQPILTQANKLEKP